MRSSLALLGLVAAVSAMPASSSGPPSGCSSSYSGTFEVTIVNVTSSPTKRELTKRAPLMLTLNNGILLDALGRTGYIASNDQFQFDNPPQGNALTASGFSVCGNGSLALGGSAIWWACNSGGFANLYDASLGAQCYQIYIELLSGSSSPATGTVSTQVPQRTDGQPFATTIPISQIGDGQPQAPTGVPISQIGDGQPQAPTGVPISQIGDGQPQAPTGVPISQIGDGQPQAPTGVPVSQIGDGQPQAPTGVPVSQIGDGQPQAPTGVPISQAGDGQPQATPAASTLSITPAASTTNGTAPATFTGAAAAWRNPGIAALIGVVGAVALL